MKYTILSILFVVLLLVVGCSLLPAKPGSTLPGETTNEPATQSAAPSAAAPTAEPGEKPAEEVKEPAPEIVPEKKYVASVPEVPNETNVTPVQELIISGNLDLQGNLDVCPHLVRSFECDRYDVRSCKFKNIVGQNDFFPDVMACRSGYSYRNEDPNHKYCFIQECRALEKGNVVYAYGGPVAYAEYIYQVDSVPGGIMTHYTLAKCGEERQEFKTSSACKTYNYQLKSI